MGGEQPAVPSVQELDIRQEDLLRYPSALLRMFAAPLRFFTQHFRCSPLKNRLTNAGTDVGYAVFLVDLAAAAGALSVYVTHNEFYHKQGQGLLPYRGAPLVDTELLLKMVEPDSQVVDLPFAMEGLHNPYVSLDPDAGPSEGGETKACSDFALSSKTVDTQRAYALTVGDTEQEDICTFYFTPGQGATSGKTRAAGRVDYRALKAMRA